MIKSKFKSKNLSIILMFILTFIWSTSAYSQIMYANNFDTVAAPTGTGTSYIATVGTLNFSRVTTSTFTTPITTPYAGSGMAMWDAYSGSNPSAGVMTSRSIDISTVSPGNGLRLSFWFFRHTNSTQSTESRIAVRFGSTNVFGSSISVDSVYAHITRYPVVSTSGWYQYSYDVPTSLLTNPNLFIFLSVTGDWWNNICLDEMVLFQTPPMVYSSNTVTQPTTNGIGVGSVNQQMLCVKIATSGISNPISVGGLNFSTTGTTPSALSQIINAKLYFTGVSPVFNTSNQVGSTINNPSGSFLFNGSRTLTSTLNPSDTNYFWLTYDIAPTATGSPIFNAALTSLTVGGSATTPSPNTPPGPGRQLNPPMNGLYTVGLGGNYTTITEAFNSIASRGVNGPVTFELINSLYSTSTGELFPITLGSYIGMSAQNRITLKPSASNTATITGSSASSLFIFDGAKYVNIDGRWDASNNTRNLTIENSSTSNNACAVQFINDAIGGNLRNTIVRTANNGTNTAAPVFGAVYIGRTTQLVPFGNDSITVRNNYFARSGNLPYSKAIVSDGQSAIFQNDAGTIDSNEFNGFTQNGIFVTPNSSGNGSNWRINNNHFYDTATTTSTNAIVCINFNPSTTSNSNGNIISNNFIGGNAAFAPTAAGQHWNITSAIAFTGIISSGGSGTGTQITNNTIRSLRINNTGSFSQVIGINPINPGLSIVTGNTIGHVTDTNSVLTNITAALIGISASTTNDLTIANNNIYNLNAAGNNTSSAVRGIVVTTASNNVLSITNNVIRALHTRSTNTGSTTFAAWNGIAVSSSSPNQTISNNIIGGSNLSDSCSVYYGPVPAFGLAAGIAGGAKMVGIATTIGTNIITNNSIRSLFSQSNVANTTNTLANIAGIIVSTGNSGNIIQNNVLDSFILRTTGIGHSIVGIVLSSGGANTSNNTIADFYSPSTSATTSTGCAISGINSSSSVPQVISNNTINNFDCWGNAATQVNGIVFSTGSGHTIQGNTITNLRSFTTSATGIAGINNQSFGLNNLISANTIHSLTAYNIGTTTPGIFGIIYGGSATVVGNTNNLITRNAIHSFGADNTGSGSLTMTGIQITGGNSTIANNFVRIGRDSSGTPISRLGVFRGIHINTLGAIQNRILHNTVYVETQPALAGTGTSAVVDLAGAITGVGFTDIRNNIFVNKTANVLATGNHYIIRTSAANLLQHTINNNIYDMNAGANNFIGRVGTIDYATISSWKAGALVDGATGFGAISFINSTGNFVNLNLRLSGANMAESAGDPAVASIITNDFDGLLRSNLTPTDIGASASSNGISFDINPPLISFTNLTNTSSGLDRTFTATIADGGGLPLDIAKSPRVRFKKYIGGTWNSASGTLVSGDRFNGTWSFTINSVAMGGISTGDSVFYYIIAEDSLSANVSSNALFATATGVASISVDPANPAYYKITDPFPTTVTVGASGTYTSLTGTDGLFNAINNGILQANTEALIISDIVETGAVTLNRWLETGAGGYTLTIRPDALTQRIISSTVLNTNGLIRLNDVNGFRMLGYSSFGSITDTNLIVRSSNISTPALSLLNGGNGDTLNGVIFESRVSSTVSGTLFIQATALPATRGVSNMLIQGCHFRQDYTSFAASFPANGIYAIGTAPRLNSNIRITGSQFYNNANQGINIQTGSGNNWTITNNHFFYTALPTQTTSFQAINFNAGQTSDNNVISGNFIGGTAPFVGGSPYVISNQFVGMAVLSGIVSGTTINNNVISNINVTSTSGMTGIFIQGTSAIYTVNGNRIGDFNNIASSIIFTSTSNSRLQGINSFATGNVTITNDTVVNILNQGAGASAGITGINVGSGGSNTTIISNNLVRNLVLTATTNAGTTTAATLQGITCTSFGLNQTISNNTVRSLVVSNAANHQVIGIQNTSGSTTISGNSVYGILSNTNSITQAFPTNWSTSTGMGIIGISNSSTSTGTQNIINNIVDSVSAFNSTAAHVTFGISVGGGFGTTSQGLVQNNTVRNMYSASNLAAASVFTSSTVTAALVGIWNSNPSPNQDVSRNMVFNLNHTNNSSTAVIGIANSASNSFNGNNSTVTRNFVHSIRSAAVSPNVPVLVGIWNTFGIATYANNMVRMGIDSSATIDTSNRITRGIYQDPLNTNANRYYHNSILVMGAPASGSANTAAIEIGASIPSVVGFVNVVDIRNNILANRVSSVLPATGSNFGLRLVNTNNIISNYNIFNITGINGFVVGTNVLNYPTLAGSLISWAATGLDVTSASVDPNFSPNSLGTADLATLALQGTNPAERSGDPTLTSVTTDYFGTVRASNTPSDIGAHAGNFNLVPDAFPPVITFTPLVNTGTLSGSRAFSNVTIIDNNGIPTSGVNRPRVYYSKDGSTWFSAGSTTITGTPTNANVSFNIDYAPLAPLTVNDTIRYYVIAQDNAGNVISNSPYAVASDVNTVTTHPVNPNRFTFLPIIAANSVFQVGSGSTYTSLTGAGGFFEFINSRTLGGNIFADITSDLLNESGAVSLNQFAEDGAGAGTYTLTIRPVSGTTTPLLVEGNVTNTLINLNGASRVKITGVPNNGVSTARLLTFRNNNLSAATIQIANGAQGVRLNNLNIEGGNTSNASGVVAIRVLSGLVPCSNDTISGCIIRNNATVALPNGVPNFGIYTDGTVGVLNAANVFINNEIANYLNTGIAVANNNGNGYVITGNSMYNNIPVTLAAATQFVGINFFTNNNSSGNTITGNFIGGSSANANGTWNSSSLTTAFLGIRAAVGTGANTLLDNNTIRNINFSNTGSAGFTGIVSDNGNIIITNNTIGSTTTNNSIVFANAGTHSGIIYQGLNNAVINNNTIAGLNVGTLGQTATLNLINVANNTTTFTSGAVSAINGNTIGSALANSIVNNGTGITTGITCTQPVNLLPSFTVNNNTIRNIFMPGTQSSLSIRGILTNFQTAAPIISGNVINNLSSNSTNLTSTGTGMAIVGIALASSSNVVANVTNNTISALRALNTSNTATPNVTGISLSSGQNTIINANRIFDLTNASTSTSLLPTPSVAGISVSGGSVNAFATNNQITLGSSANQNTQFNGIWLILNTTGFTLNAINNSVLITGASAGGNQNSYAFLRGNNTATEIGTYINLQNNILANNRTGGTGTHYAIANQTPAPTNNTWVNTSSQYNLLVTNNANAVGQWGTNAVNYSNWIASSTSDNRSYYMTAGTTTGLLNLSNLFTNITNGDLGINASNIESWYVYGKAVAGTSVNNLATDYTGAARGTLFGFANTIGSIQLNSVPTVLPPAAVASVSSAANTTVNYTFASRAVASINWGASAPTSASLLNFTGITPANQPSGNNANQYLRVDLAGGTTPYNYSVVYNYDPALMGAISSANNLKVSTQTAGSTITSPVWLTQPIATVNATANTVTTGALTTSLANMYLTVTENNAPPVITGIVPASGPVGATISIRGRNFTGTTSLGFANGITQPTFTVVNDTTITTTIPTGAVTGVISATNANGTGISVLQLNVIQLPTVSSFSPQAGTFGTLVTINGTNFNSATQVQFNGINATSFTVVNATTITATVPSNALATGLVSVINPAGSGASTSNFTVYGVPTISSFTPSSAAVGTTVLINGTNFEAITNVRFNGVNSSYTVNSNTSISAIVPAGATTGIITVVNGSGTGTSATNFTVQQLPTITTFSPSSGGVGTSVVINGTNFTGATAVTFNGTPAASFVVNSSTQITAVVATGTSTGIVAVTTPSGSANTTGSNFTVISDLVVSTNTFVNGTYNNITVTSTGVANLNGTLTALGNVLIQTGGTMNFSDQILTGNGNFTTQSGTRLIVGSPAGISATGGISGNIQVAGTRTFASAASITYNGITAQVAGEGLTNIDTLVINNSNGVTLNFAATVNNSLTLTSGMLILGNNNLTLGANATVVGASASAYVVTSGTGLLRRTIQNNATNVLFPIGSASYTPANIQLSAASTTDVFGVRVFNGVFSTGNNTGGLISNNVVNRTWFITEAVTGGSIASIQLAWDDSIETIGFNRTNCAIARHNGSSYVTFGTTPFGASTLVSGQRTRSLTNLTSFGNFAIGDNISTLPVKLISFNGIASDNDALLNWSTSVEINNKGFEIERSIDGELFETIGFIKGKGNSNAIVNYSFTDANVFVDSKFAYYRLKQVDFDGKFEYSKTIKVTNSNVSFDDVKAYPNPFANELNISFNSAKNTSGLVEITNIQGKVITVKNTDVQKGLNTITLTELNDLSAGIYFVRLSVNGETQVMKLVKN